MIQYNRHGLDRAKEESNSEDFPKIKLSHNLTSLLRLFIVIMVFVVIVLTISK